MSGKIILMKNLNILIVEGNQQEEKLHLLKMEHILELHNVEINNEGQNNLFIK
jgi:hypothetical protein